MLNNNKHIKIYKNYNKDFYINFKIAVYKIIAVNAVTVDAVTIDVITADTVTVGIIAVNHVTGVIMIGSYTRMVGTCYVNYHLVTWIVTPN